MFCESTKSVSHWLSVQQKGGRVGGKEWGNTIQGFPHMRSLLPPTWGMTHCTCWSSRQVRTIHAPFPPKHSLGQFGVSARSSTGSSCFHRHGPAVGPKTMASLDCPLRTENQIRHAYVGGRGRGKVNRTTNSQMSFSCYANITHLIPEKL